MSSFKLFHLPSLAYEHVIKLMITQEIFCLSLCSKKVAQILKNMKIDVETIMVYYYPSFTIQIDRTYHETCFVEMRKVDDRKYIESVESRISHTGWRSLYYWTMNDYEDCARFSDHVQSIFNIQQFEIVVYSEEQEDEKMRKRFSTALSKKYDRVSVFGEEDISLEFFNYLMDTVHLNASLQIDCIVPEHCQHKNKLKFKSLEYSKADWVTLDDLKSIRNMDSFTLEYTSLTCQDFNKFLHFWINCEEDMMKCLTLVLARGIDMNRDTVLKDIENVIVKQSEYRKVYYILARKHPERKFIVGEITFKSIRMELRAYEPSEYLHDTISSLECLEKKKSLKKEKIEVEKDESAFAKNWTQHTVGEFDQVIKTMRTRKEDIDNELEAIQKKLIQLGFVDFD